MKVVKQIDYNIFFLATLDEAVTTFVNTEKYSWESDPADRFSEGLFLKEHNVDPIHFDYQSHTRNVENITSSEVSFYKIYDIEQMTFDDFTFINNLFPDSLDLTENTIKSLRLSWHNGKHEIRNKNVSDVSDVSKLTINELKNLPVNPSYNKFFLDDSLKENIRKIYFKDYEFFQIHNINFPEIFSGNII